MDQQIPGMPPTELPRPQRGNEIAPTHEVGGLPLPESVAAKALERAPQSIPSGPTSQPMISVTSTPGIPTPVPQPLIPAPVIAGGTPAIADDADLIEKEWIVKAKQIVAQTKDDPYQQNQAMTTVKADYQKKRFNHDLKVSQD